MDQQQIPNFISHDLLLQAIHDKSCFTEEGNVSVYLLQLKHNLLSLARKAHLEVMVNEVTDLDPQEIASKSVVELLVLLERARGAANGNYGRFWS